MKILYNTHKKFTKKRPEPDARDRDTPRKKKSLGQHFLRKQSVVDHMIEKVSISPATSVLEIGCGDGFLTKSILEQSTCKKLICYEIDPEWASYVRERITDPRLTINLENILSADLAKHHEDTPWIVLANLPYQITFPILFFFQKNKDLFQEGVVMVQEEVAQKIVAQRGRSCNPTSLFLQHHFDWELLEKIEPGAFSPPPKVFSRLLYFKPKFDLKPIVNEEKFWDFLKMCYRSPRQTLRNNLRTTHFDLSRIPEATLKLRAQEMSWEQFLGLWQELQKP